ncbi:DUF960 family protein [Sporosarcina sp. JAI121]|uniref:DUF960 family protein n=1 Tax=Sporosarcina sp. JAI121 TaxID=2723064 RepID=UPI0015CA9836|nr:DUF960 family protein [Sporosarcina sp. JAI121]NYF23563.1 hypothetical protein [Sporosarcina sp. JAI121]
MFDNKEQRYMTRAIAEELHSEIAILLWRLIDVKNIRVTELDYLQVFELSISNGKQAIIHRQEVPERQRLWILPLEDTEPIIRTIWCIDNGESQMMLFPEDY